jgi:BlaI family transcriptional regulator, penicillinase repressor
VMPTMDRLFKKGLLTRRKVGRAFVYRAAATRNEIEEAVVTELMQSLFNRPGNVSLPLLSSLVDAVSDKDRALLDDLERLIHEKKRKMNDESNR